MLFNLLSTDGETIALGVVTLLFVGGLVGTGLFFLIRAIVRGDFKRTEAGEKVGFAIVTKKEKLRLYCSECPFTGEALKREVLEDKSYRTEVREVERYHFSNVTSNSFSVDKTPTKHKVGGEYVLGDSLTRYTSPTFKYSVLKEVKYSTAWGSEKTDDGIEYKVTTTTYKVESYGILADKKRAKLANNCRKNSKVEKFRK